MPNQNAASQQRAHGFLSALRPEETCAFIDFAGDNDLPGFKHRQAVLREELPQFWHFERKDLREILPSVIQRELPVRIPGGNGFVEGEHATVR